MGGRKDICGARFGTSFESKKWRSLDICGSIGVTLSVSVHAFAFVVISKYLIADSLIANGIFLLFYFPAFFLALSSLYMAWSSDPGAVPMGARPLVTVRNTGGGSVSTVRRRGLRRCPKCGENFKPGRAHHDSVTGRCIVKFDHFCPWIGNAVGAMNHKFFILFVGYTMVSCLFSLLLIGLRTLYCGSPSPYFSHSDDSPEECKGWNESYLGLALLVVSVVFFLFTACMFFEQVEAVTTNISKIARMQMSVGRGGTELNRVTDEFNEIFGGESNEIAWHWFLPIPIEFPNGMKKVVMGYEWDETFDLVPYQDPNDRDEETGSIHSASSNNRIELTTIPPAPQSNGSQTEEGGIVPKKLDRPQLVNRRNSKDDYDKDDAFRPSGGTLS